jgi:hypothetical protein
MERLGAHNTTVWVTENVQ